MMRLDSGHEGQDAPSFTRIHARHVSVCTRNAVRLALTQASQAHAVSFGTLVHALS
jgi:hypothetical protein